VQTQLLGSLTMIPLCPETHMPCACGIVPQIPSFSSVSLFFNALMFSSANMPSPSSDLCCLLPVAQEYDISRQGTLFKPDPPSHCTLSLCSICMLITNLVLLNYIKLKESASIKELPGDLLAKSRSLNSPCCRLIFFGIRVHDSDNIKASSCKQKLGSKL